MRTTNRSLLLTVLFLLLVNDGLSFTSVPRTMSRISSSRTNDRRFQQNIHMGVNKNNKFRTVLKSTWEGIGRRNPLSFLRKGISKGRVLLANFLCLFVFCLGRGSAVSARSSAESVAQHYSSQGRSRLVNSRKESVQLEQSRTSTSYGRKMKEAIIVDVLGKTDTHNAIDDDDDFDEDEAEDNEAVKEVKREVKRSLRGLLRSMQGAKLDSLIILIATGAVIPIFNRLNTSPIIGFLLTGTLLGPRCLNWIKDVHLIDILGELGIVFFLFEMGLELSLEKLKAMRRDVFGLGTSQFLLTAAAGAGISLASGLAPAAAVTIGGSLALSSSAFVLQLLKDRDDMGTRYGKASFGILLLQDLAVVPLLVVVELLSKGSAGLGKALTFAGVKAIVSLSSLSYVGRIVLDPIFAFVAKSRSQEAFLGIILSTVLLMSFVTQGIGLSNTLGAFLAGLLLSETSYHYQIESDIAPFRGLLLGIFFITVGFSIDVPLLFREAPTVLGLVSLLITAKAAIVTSLCLAFGMSLANAQQCGLLVSAGGEFAFVALGIAERAGLIPSRVTKLLLTAVALSMALTPALADAGNYIANRLEQNIGFANMMAQAPQAKEKRTGGASESFVLVCGYGRVGKMVCDMLDRTLIRYVALDNNPQRAFEANSKGVPVYFGDINRPEVLRSFKAGSAQACVIAISDMSAVNKAVLNIRKTFPQLPIVARAKDDKHQKRLENMFDDVYAMHPVLADDSVLLTLPFGGAVLRQSGVSKPEIDAILEEFREMYCADSNINDDDFDFLNSFRRRLPPSTVEVQVGSAGGTSASDDDEGYGFLVEPSASDKSISVSNEDSKQLDGEVKDLFKVKEGAEWGQK